MMASPPRVSVCIVTYNQARYIEDTVLGALGQSGDFQLEVLVGNDRSSDDTAAILDRLRQRHPDRLVVLNRPANLGPGGNLEDLMQRATGDFIAHLDGDDAWLPGKLRAQLAFLATHPECPAVYTNGLVVDPDGRLRGSFTDAHPPLMPLAYLCARGNYLMHSAMMYRRECMPDLLALGSSLIDYRQHLTLARRGPLGFIDAPFAVYRLATTTSLVRKSTDWLQRQIWAALQEATAGLPEVQRREALAHFMASVLLSCVSGDRSASWTLLREAARDSGYSRVSLLRAVLPSACAIAAHGVLRRLLLRIGAGARLAEYYRV
jgi:glycosyltransferase involved in cell wall biosynthesis